MIGRPCPHHHVRTRVLLPTRKSLCLEVYGSVVRVVFHRHVCLHIASSKHNLLQKSKKTDRGCRSDESGSGSLSGAGRDRCKGTYEEL